MSSDWISPSNLPPLSASARLSASSSKVSGSRPSVISFGRSTISPTPTMTGMRSSGMGDLLGISSCFFQTPISFVIASEAKQSIIPAQMQHGLLRRCAARNDGVLLSDQRIHVLDRLDEIFLELLHHRARRLHAVDQADALADEVAHEIARLGVAGGG